jgi:cell division inhibitor SepF
MYNTKKNEEEYVEESTTLGARLKDWFGRFRDQDEDEEEIEGDIEAETVSYEETRRPASTTFSTAPNMRVSRVREQAIHVLSAATFADIQKAADGIKQGIPQVVNLEKADAVMAERLKDFMNGVTYALDGYVEKISEKSYLFTPRTVEIKTEPTGAPGNMTSNRTLFFDKLN